MTIREAAQRVGKSEDSLRRAIKAGKLSATLVNGKYDISDAALDAYASAHAVHTQTPAAASSAESEIVRLRAENEKLKQELVESRRILEDNRQRQDTIILQLTRQLDQQRMLEAHREPWFRRWFKR